MKRLIGLLILLSLGLVGSKPASAQGLFGGLLTTIGQLTGAQNQQQGVIVRTTLGLQGLQNLCLSSACTVVSNLDGNTNQLFLVKPAQGLLPQLLADLLRLVNGILDAEPDQTLMIPPNTSGQATASTAPQGLWDNVPVNYYGNMTTDGYVNQPAAQIIRVAQAHKVFGVSGSGIVADIDTGVDPNHPALQGVLLPGYDFTRNQPGGSELNDISLSAPPPCETCAAAYVNQHTAAMLDGSQYAAFGHGTMVMGVIHLVAPTAKLLPLKAFTANGNGSLSNILAAIYYT